MTSWHDCHEVIFYIIMNNIKSILNFTLKTNIKKGSYWIWMLWPLSTLIMLTGIYLSTSNNKISDISNSNIILYSSSLILLNAIYFAPAIGNEILDDKSSKINKYLLSITNIKNLILGKVFGIICLMILSMMIYILLFISFISLLIQNNLLSNKILLKLNHYLPYNQIIESIIMIIIANIFIILLATLITCFFESKKKLFRTYYNIHIYIIICIFVSYKLSSVPHIILNLFPVISQVVNLKLIINNNFNFYYFITSLSIQIFEMICIIIFTLHLYKKK